MSFASEVKKELLSIEDEPQDVKKAMLLGILQGSASLVISNGKPRIVLKSYLLSTLNLTLAILKNDYHIATNIRYSNTTNINKLRYYYLDIDEKVNEIIKEYYLSIFDTIDLNINLLQTLDQQKAFVRGMFIARGSINDPRKNSYHFEISCKNIELAETIKQILISNEIDTKISERKNNYYIYVKKSENISSLLALMGASSGVFYFEDSRIVRDLNNMANRVTNCDIANLKKASDVANKHFQAIEYIKSKDMYNKISPRLQATIRLREEYPVAPMEELSEYSANIFGKKLSKSGISHCFSDLLKYYEELKRKHKK